jgi:hypothetical protein
MSHERRPMTDRSWPLTVSSTWFCPPRHVRAVSICSENTFSVLRFGSWFWVRLQFPQLREFQEHVIRVQRRDDQSGNTVANAATGNVVAKKRERWMAGKLQQARAATAFLHLFRGVGGVSVDGLEVLGDIAVGKVFDFAIQAADRAVDADSFVDDCPVHFALRRSYRRS